MNERTWWSLHVKPRWHRPASGRIAWKVENRYNAGMPDVDFCFHGVTGKLELKYTHRWPSNPDKFLTFSDDKAKNKLILSPEQVRHLDEWTAAGGLGYVLIGVGYECLLLSPGAIINSGMTRAQLLDAAQFHGDSYDSLAAIPTIIEADHGRQ